MTEEQKASLDLLAVYNECFGTNIDESHYAAGVKLAIEKKLNKLRGL